MAKSLVFSIASSRKTSGRKKKSTKKKKSGGVTKKNKKSFVKRAAKHQGSFTRYCNGKGFRGASGNCMKYAMSKGSPRRKKQAVLTKRLKNL